VNLVLVEPDPQAGRWVFPAPLLGCRSLQELYRLAGANPQQRATVPLLLDPGSESRSPVILSNESAELVQLLNRWPGSAMDLEPEPLLEAIEQWSQQLQHSLNDGVYRCGFARSQTAYDRAEAALFAALEALEESLSGQGPWLCGAQLTLADVRLFPTLIRWEQVYAPLFGCSRQPLWCFPALWQWRARFLALPGVLETCDPLAWRTDYFGALFPLRPSALVPAGPMDGAALQQLVQRPVPSTMET
ncbi:MAG: glutathione-dependent reductase, partial [Synechococcus sp. TMED185]